MPKNPRTVLGHLRLLITKPYTKFDEESKAEAIRVCRESGEPLLTEATDAELLKHCPY